MLRKSKPIKFDQEIVSLPPNWLGNLPLMDLPSPINRTVEGSHSHVDERPNYFSRYGRKRRPPGWQVYSKFECTGNVTHVPHHNYRVNTEPKHIPVISTTSVDTKITQKHRSRNMNNLIEIPLETPARTANIRSKFAYLPAFLLSNVMSLAPKIDEVRDVIYRGNYDFVSFVETWQQGHIHDNVVDIQGYNLIRRDRCERQHGGVCIYIKDTI
jgi:hypothetical protein